jgi:hypothetical protein
MSGTLSDNVVTSFTSGLVYGLELVTFGYANRWLLLADEGWRIRKNINWPIVIITNLIWAMTTADAAVALHMPMAEMDFIQQGHLPSEYITPPWQAITLVSLIAARKIIIKQ